MQQMDNGSGILHRFLITIPKSLTPLKSEATEAEQRRVRLRQSTLQAFMEKIDASIDSQNPIIFYLDAESER